MGAIDEYIDKYCKKHEIDKEEAKTHAIVKETQQYYKKIEQKKNENDKGAVE